MRCITLTGSAILTVMLLSAPPALCGLSINELMADPNSDWDGDGVYEFRDDEWVEIYNDGPGDVDLSSYLVGDADGLLAYRYSGVLNAGEALVVYGSQSQEWQSNNGVSSLGFNMSNDGDTVVLYMIDNSDTLVVDSHTFNTNEAEDDRSTGRNPDGTGDWEIFDALNPYGGDTPPLGNGLPPTPGFPNDSGPVATRALTWGVIKSLYEKPL
jgi:hypothetical protein